MKKLKELPLLHSALHALKVLEYSSLSWAECILVEVPNGYFKGGVLCSEYITCIPTPIFHINSDSAVFHVRLSPKLLLNQVRMLLTCSHSTLEKNDKQVRLGGGGVEG